MQPRARSLRTSALARVAAFLFATVAAASAQQDARDALREHGSFTSVSGWVADESGDPLPAADVWLLPEGELLEAAGLSTTRRSPDTGWSRPRVETLDDAPLNLFAHGETNARGHFLVQGAAFAVAPSDRLTWDPAPLPRSAQLVAHAPGHALAVIPLARLDDLRDDEYSLRLPREARATGRVLDAQGAPLAHAEVRVADLRVRHPKAGFFGLRHDPEVTLPRWHRTHTDVDGRFSLGALWRGDVTLRVHAPGHLPREVGPFAVDAGDTLELDDVSLSPASLLRGSVTDASGAPLAGARVFAARDVPRHAGRIDIIEPFGEGDDRLPLELEVEHHRDTVRGVTGDDGSFALEVAPDADLFVFARHPGFEPARVERGAEPRRPVALVLQPAARLLVRVVDHLGGDVGDDVQLLARRLVAPGKQGGRLEVQRLADGRFEIDGIGPRGTQLIARRADKPETWLTVAEGAAPGSTHEVTLTAHEPASLSVYIGGREDLRSPRVSIELRGTAAGSGAERVWMISKRGGDARRFHFADLPPGRYELRLTEPDHGGGAALVKPLIVDLAPGEVRDDVTFTLGSAAR